MSRNKRVIYGLVFICALFFLYKYAFRGMLITRDIVGSDGYRMNLAHFAEMEAIDQEVFLIGNSIMAGFNDSSLGYPVINTAIKGDVSLGINMRRDILLKHQPRWVVVGLGINDILNGIGFSLNEFESFSLFQKQQLPHTQVVFLSVTPTRLQSGVFIDPEKVNEEVQAANREVKEFCKEKGYSYLDIWTSLQENGDLKEGLTYDGVHFTPRGYEVYGDILKKFLDENYRK